MIPLDSAVQRWQPTKPDTGPLVRCPNLQNKDIPKSLGHLCMQHLSWQYLSWGLRDFATLGSILDSQVI